MSIEVECKREPLHSCGEIIDKYTVIDHREVGFINYLSNTTIEIECSEDDVMARVGLSNTKGVWVERYTKTGEKSGVINEVSTAAPILMFRNDTLYIGKSNRQVELNFSPESQANYNSIPPVVESLIQ